jgi:hypothetical protein
MRKVNIVITIILGSILIFLVYKYWINDDWTRTERIVFMILLVLGPINSVILIRQKKRWTMRRTKLLLKEIKIAPAPNTDGLINCLPQPGLPSNEPPKSIRLNSFRLIKSCGTLTASSPGTESVGLRADAMVPCFLLAIWTVSSWPKTHTHHPDLVPFRQIIMTQNLSSTYRDWQKTRHPDTDANSIKPPGRQTVQKLYCFVYNLIANY